MNCRHFSIRLLFLDRQCFIYTGHLGTTSIVSWGVFIWTIIAYFDSKESPQVATTPLISTVFETSRKSFTWPSWSCKYVVQQLLSYFSTVPSKHLPTYWVTKRISFSQSTNKLTLINRSLLVAVSIIV